MQRLEQAIAALPRDSCLRCMQRAEALGSEVDPAVTYPEAWVAFRIVGAGAKGMGEGLIAGADLRASLSPLVERLSAAVSMQREEAGPDALDAAQLCERWHISRATLNRLRSRGLVARRVLDDSKRHALVFRLEVVERFESTNGPSLARAAGFSRVDPAATSRLIRRAEGYRRRLDWTLNQCACRLAEKTGRSQEGVRQLLLRAAVNTAPSLREAPALGERQRELLYRAWRRGVDLSQMSRRTHRSRGAVRRAITMARAARLRSILDSGALHGPVSAPRSKPPESLLALPPVRSGLASPHAPDVLTFLAAARAMGPPIGAEEKARLAAYQLLRAEAARLINGLSLLQPSPAAVDRTETHLLWAARIKAELIGSQVRLLLDTLAARLGRDVEELPPAAGLQVITEGLRVIGDAVDGLDPAKAGRLAAATSLMLDRYAAGAAKQLTPAVPQTRRATVVMTAGLAMPRWERDVSPWQKLLEPDRRLRPGIVAGVVPTAAADVLTRRYGWDGGPPRTLAELAGELHVTPIRVLKVERDALRAALVALRAATAARLG